MPGCPSFFDNEPKRRSSLTSSSSSRSHSISVLGRQKAKTADASLCPGEGGAGDKEVLGPSPVCRRGSTPAWRQKQENSRKGFDCHAGGRTRETSAEETSPCPTPPTDQVEESGRCPGRSNYPSAVESYVNNECCDGLEDQPLSTRQQRVPAGEEEEESDSQGMDLKDAFRHQKVPAKKELYGEVVLGFCLAPRELIEGGSVGPGVPLLFRAEYTPPPDLSPSVWEERGLARAEGNEKVEETTGSVPSPLESQDKMVAAPGSGMYSTCEEKEEQEDVDRGDNQAGMGGEGKSKEYGSEAVPALATEKLDVLATQSSGEGTRRENANVTKGLNPFPTVETALAGCSHVVAERWCIPEGKDAPSSRDDQGSQSEPLRGGISSGNNKEEEDPEGHTCSPPLWSKKKSGAHTARENTTEGRLKREQAPRRSASHPHHQPAVRFQIPPSSSRLEAGGQEEVQQYSNAFSAWKDYTGKPASALKGDREKPKSCSLAGDAGSKSGPLFCPLCLCEAVEAPGEVGCSCMETPSGARISHPFVEGFPSKSTTLRFSRPCVLVSADLNVEGLESLMAVDGVIACVQQEVEGPSHRRPAASLNQNPIKTSRTPSLRIIPSKAQQGRGDSASVSGRMLRGKGSVSREVICHSAARPRGDLNEGTLAYRGAATPALRVVGAAGGCGGRRGTPFGSTRAGGASAPVVPALGWVSSSGEGMTPGGRTRADFPGGERAAGLLLRPGGVRDHAVGPGLVAPLTGGSIPRRHRLEYHREKWLMDSEWRERHLLEAAATAVEAERALGFPQIVCGMWVKPCLGDGHSDVSEHEHDDGDSDALVLLSSRCVPVIDCEEEDSSLDESRTM